MIVTICFEGIDFQLNQVKVVALNDPVSKRLFHLEHRKSSNVLLVNGFKVVDDALDKHKTCSLDVVYRIDNSLYVGEVNNEIVVERIILEQEGVEAFSVSEMFTGELMLSCSLKPLMVDLRRLYKITITPE